MLTISGYSTALYGTWFLIENYGVLLDAGDGVAAGLLSKVGKIKHVFISHADRDHLSGLLFLGQLGTMNRPFSIYHPKDSGSFPFLAEFQRRFDPVVDPPSWEPLSEQALVPITKQISIKAIRNEHIRSPDTRSVSYLLQQRKRKLKTEFQALSGPEIGRLRKEHGDDFITKEQVNTLLAYSADTPISDFSQWEQPQVLIHEATFLNREDMDKQEKHSVLGEVLLAASKKPPKILILSHFSSRYKPEEIDKAIIQHCEDFQCPFPVYRLLPRQVVHDILAQDPIWKGTSP